MTRREDISLDEVRAAKQHFEPSAEDWVDSERGQRVLEHVLAADRAAAARRTAQRRRSRPQARLRLAFVAAALVLVAAVGSLTAVLVDRGKDITSGTVVSTLSPNVGVQVSQADAVVNVMPLYVIVSRNDWGAGNDDASQLELAVRAGLVTSEEVSGDSGSRVMTQGEYAALLARAFLDVLLAVGPFDTAPGDHQAPVDERAAIEFLRTSGIILSEDPAYDADQPLTKTVEDRLLSRIEEAWARLSDN